MLLWKLFLHYMKKTAFIFLLLFAFVQAGSAVSSILTGINTVFIVDEEKNNEKPEKEKKEKKDFSSLTTLQISFIQKPFQLIYGADKLFSHPCIEQQTPPPNGFTYLFKV